jgi:hypothetical protein
MARLGWPQIPDLTGTFPEPSEKEKSMTIIREAECSRCGYRIEPGADELREWVWVEEPDGTLADRLCIACNRDVIVSLEGR